MSASLSDFNPFDPAVLESPFEFDRRLVAEAHAAMEGVEDVVLLFRPAAGPACGKGKAEKGGVGLAAGVISVGGLTGAA